ncbi:forkhead box A2-like [Tubulinosema ratisbonensis]|uniref:Forkhead box A2-like n=1 Tax=Tubulinosema ratisbonensis TaxID=291195 RepID=A0A437ALY8_9MICR|nr:forkhead box A2-like [Tubulinosema ratisbonensis]
MKDEDLVSALLMLKHSDNQKNIIATLISGNERIEITNLYYRHICFDISFEPSEKCWYITTKTNLIINEVDVQSNIRLPLKNNSDISYPEDHFLSQEKGKKFLTSTKKIKTYNFRYYNVKQAKSYKQIITEALTKNKCMSLNEIYKYFEKFYNFSYEDSMTWKNSIRHNLSINREFIKVSDEKGSQWTLSNENTNKFSPSPSCSISPHEKRPVDMSNMENNFNINFNKINTNSPYTSLKGNFNTNSSFLRNYVYEPIYKKSFFERKQPMTYPVNLETNKRRRMINDTIDTRNYTNNLKNNYETNCINLESDSKSLVFEISESTDINELGATSDESSEESSSALWKSRRNKK